MLLGILNLFTAVNRTRKHVLTAFCSPQAAVHLKCTVSTSDHFPLYKLDLSQGTTNSAVQCSRAGNVTVKIAALIKVSPRNVPVAATPVR